MTGQGLRRAVGGVSGLLVLAGAALWWRERTALPPPDPDRPLGLRFHSGGDARWTRLSADGARVLWYDELQVRAADADGAGVRTVCEAPYLSIAPGAPRTAALTPDGRYLVAVQQTRLQRIRLDDARPEVEVPVPPGTRLLDLTDDGRRALLTLQPPLAALVVADLAERRVVARLTHAAPQNGWLVAEGAQILLGAVGDAPELWSVATGEPLPTPWRTVPGVRSAHRVGRRTALFCGDGFLRWLDGGRPLETPLRRADLVLGDGRSGSLRLDGPLVALGAPQSQGSLLVGPDGRRKVAAPGDTVLALSSRGDYVLTRGDTGDRQVVFGRLSTGREWFLPETAGRGASAASFSGDGARLAVAAAAGLFVFDVRPIAPLRR